MKRLQQVIWTKGTFLTPQHLQIQDRFLENLLQFQIESLSFRPWGFRTLQITQEGLAAGYFRRLRRVRDYAGWPAVRYSGFRRHASA